VKKNSDKKKVKKWVWLLVELKKSEKKNSDNSDKSEKSEKMCLVKSFNA